MTDKITTASAVGVFQKSEPALASQQAPQILKFQRPDWALFRTVEGLQQRAGVPKSKLRRLVLKELADNGLDSGANVRVGKVDGGYFVEDDGSGIDPDDVARLFSIARPMVSFLSVTGTTGTYDRPLAQDVTLRHPISRASNPAPKIPAGIVPDAKWPGMYRLKLPDGSESEMVNLTRAKDAFAEMRGRR